jgi:hypothetical protein
MSITAISSDFSQSPRTVRITSTNTLAEITTTGYLLTEADTIKELNAGAFTFEEGDLCLINYSDGEGWFTVDFTNNTFLAEVDPGNLSETLASGNIFVGSALNVATGVTMSGDATIDNTGDLTIADDAITTAKIDDEAVTAGKLATALQPSHVVKFAGQPTTGGGNAAEAITVTGALATDLAFVEMVDPGTNTVSIVQAVVTADTLTVTFSGDPGNDAVINYQLLRAIA